jgi:hypothetical protein
MAHQYFTMRISLIFINRFKVLFNTVLFNSVRVRRPSWFGHNVAVIASMTE